MAEGRRKHVPTPAELDASVREREARRGKGIRARIAHKLGLRPGVGESRRVAPAATARGPEALTEAAAMREPEVASQAPRVPESVVPEATRPAVQRRITIGRDVRAARGGATSRTASPEASAQPREQPAAARRDGKKLPPGASAPPRGVSQFHTDVG